MLGFARGSRQKSVKVNRNFEIIDANDYVKICKPTVQFRVCFRRQLRLNQNAVDAVIGYSSVIQQICFGMITIDFSENNAYFLQTRTIAANHTRISFNFAVRKSIAEALYIRQADASIIAVIILVPADKGVIMIPRQRKPPETFIRDDHVVFIIIIRIIRIIRIVIIQNG